VRTNVAVGDLPREADTVLLRRLGTGAAPFTGMLRWLTAWNVLEFKGPTVTPRPRDLALLVEVGLGIDRRLNGERRRAMPEREVSFWYLANRLSRGFLEEAEGRLGTLEPLAAGVWRGQALTHPCRLVSTVDLPVDEDSLPLHVVGAEPEEKERQVGEFVVAEQERLSAYGGIFATLHPHTWKELQVMAKSRNRRIEFDIRPAVDTLGLEEVIRQIGAQAVIAQLGPKTLIEQLGLDAVLKQVKADDLMAHLPRATREELKRLLLKSETKGR
jgi:hypothetical protein